jgi:hypothetical protein
VRPLPPFVRTGQAIRLIVAEKLPGGPDHAAQMTDATICRQLLNGVWERGSPVYSSFKNAVEALEEAVLDTSVKVSIESTKGRRLVEDWERGDVFNIRRDAFDLLPSLKPEFCVADLRRVVPKVEEERISLDTILAGIFANDSEMSADNAFKIARDLGAIDGRKKIRDA